MFKTTQKCLQGMDVLRNLLVSLDLDLVFGPPGEAEHCRLWNQKGRLEF